MLLDLFPQELIAKIISCIVQDPRTRHYPQWISACTRISRKFYWAATRHRFKTLELGKYWHSIDKNGEDRVRSFILLAKASPHIFPLVLRLHIHILVHNDLEVGNVWSPTSPIWQLLDLLQANAPNLASVELYGDGNWVWLRAPYRLMDFLAMERIQYLKLANIRDIEYQKAIPTQYFNIRSLNIHAGCISKYRSSALPIIAPQDRQPGITISYSFPGPESPIQNIAEIVDIDVSPFTFESWARTGIPSGLAEMHTLGVVLPPYIDLVPSTDFSRLWAPFYSPIAFKDKSKLERLYLHIEVTIVIPIAMQLIGLSHPEPSTASMGQEVMDPHTWGHFNPSMLHKLHPRLSYLSISMDFTESYDHCFRTERRRSVWPQGQFVSQSYIVQYLTQRLLHCVSGGEEIVEGCTVKVDISV